MPEPSQQEVVTTQNGHPVQRERAAELRRGSEEGPLLTSSTATRLFPSGRMNLIKIDEIGSLSPSSAGIREERRAKRGQSLGTELPSLSVDFVPDSEFVNSCSVAIQPEAMRYYRGLLYSAQTYLRRTQAGPGRAGKQQQE